MKKLFATALIFGLPLSALAQPVTLHPGSNVVINGDVISCEGDSAAQLPACSIRQDGGYYRLYTGDTVSESYYTFDQALAGAKKVRDAGLCR